MGATWQKWLAIGGVLLATHLASAWIYADRYARGTVATPLGTMSLDLSFDQWSRAAAGSDSTVYLEVARNFANGKGVVWQVPNSDPPRSEPFYFWGPGTPVVLGAWLTLGGGQTMRTFFVFSVLCQIFFGAMAIATIALYTRRTPALLLTAFCSGFCPPLQERFFGVDLTSSEVVGLVPFSLLFFALSKAFIAYRSAPADSWRQWLSRVSWREGLPRQMVFWFALSGVFLGWYSLTRDPGRVFTWFVGTFIVARALVVDRGRLLPAMVAAMLLVAGTYAVRYPVQLWNKARSGRSTICGTSDGCIWRYGLWSKHDQFAWYESVGMGFGEYLDPDAARRVEGYYQQDKPQATFYSLYELARAIAKRPADALAFKVARLPVLWLDTDMWPRSQWRLEAKWCVLFYLALAAFIAVRVWRRQYIPEPLYLYVLLVCCSMPFIHFEFRYTFPAWHTLVLGPGLLFSLLRRGGGLLINSCEPQTDYAPNGAEDRPLNSPRGRRAA
jgi:hypothetical protein